MRICLVSSHGGHLTELLRIIEAVEGHDNFLVTYEDETTKWLHAAIPGIRRVFFIPLSNETVLQLKSPLRLFGHLIHIALKELIIFVRERPDMIISTGSEIAVPMCYFGKALGRKVIFIESLSRINELSSTGRLIYPIATLFLVQWKNLAMKHRKAQYRGRVL